MFLTFLFIVYEFVDKCASKCRTCVSSVRNQKWNLTPAPMLSVDIPVRLLCSVASLCSGSEPSMYPIDALMPTCSATRYSIPKCRLYPRPYIEPDTPVADSL